MWYIPYFLIGNIPQKYSLLIRKTKDFQMIFSRKSLIIKRLIS